MTEDERRAIEADCERLIKRYVNLNDAQDWPAVAALYTEDARFARPSQPGVFVEGREAILAELPGPAAARAAARDRQRGGRRRGRRPRARVQRDRALPGRAAPEGELPAMSANSPLVGTFTDRLVRTARRLALRRTRRRARLQAVACLASTPHRQRGGHRRPSARRPARARGGTEEGLRRDTRRRASPRRAAGRRKAPEPRDQHAHADRRRQQARAGTGRRQRRAGPCRPPLAPPTPTISSSVQRVGSGAVRPIASEARRHRAEQQHQRRALAPAVDQHARERCRCARPGEIGDPGHARRVVEREARPAAAPSAATS